MNKDKNILVGLAGKSAHSKAVNTAPAGATQTLVESRALFEGVVCSAIDAVIVVDAKRHILVFNPTAELIFGVSAKTILGHLLQQLPGSPILASLTALIRTFKEAPKSIGVYNTITGRHSNGEEFSLEASLAEMKVEEKTYLTVILRDIWERHNVEAQLRLALGRLRALGARNEAVREDERTRVAREIHDILAQNLTSLKIDLLWIANQTARLVEVPDHDTITNRIGDAIAQADSAIAAVQGIATGLRPVVLDSLGLSAAIEWQVEDFARRSGMSFRVSAPRGISLLSRESATAIFRILQESLTNIARHAQATAINVELVEMPDYATLVVTDNGCGITASQVSAAHSIGLLGIRERAQAFGGSVEINGEAGEGTVIRVRIPVDGENTARPS